MPETLLKVTALSKSFGAIRATNNFSFSITRNHIHALIGPNGAGKTTLVNQLSGDILPDSGSIIFNSVDITQLKAFQCARLGIGRSFQITQTFDNLTVAENMGLAICSHSGHNFKFLKHWRSSQPILRELAPALEQVDLLHRAEMMALHLSHGEKRQLEVGMAMVGKPKLLILDEPMAGMGPGGTAELSKLISKLRGQCTILLVEHDMDVVFSLADQVTVLVYGENLASGTPDEIRKNVQVRAAYLGEEDECSQ